MKKAFIITLSLLALPAYTFAAGSNADDEDQETVAHIFTTCTQSAIEVRDSSIGSARSAYNNAMTIALSARKDAEKKAVALADDDDKKDAIKETVGEYRKAVGQAQDALVRARKEAWSQFEESTRECREASKDNQDVTSEIRSGAKVLQTTLVSEGQKSESLKDTILMTIKNFFRRAEE